MREYQERRKIKKLLHSRYAIAVLAIVIIFLGRAVWGIYIKYERSKEINERVKADFAELSAREASLNRAISDLGSEEGREREVRDRFGVVKEGERMIVLVDGDETDAAMPKSAKKGILSRFWGFFGM